MKTIYCCQILNMSSTVITLLNSMEYFCGITFQIDIMRECNFKKFKSMISKWNGPQCSCSYCKLCILNNM